MPRAKRSGTKRAFVLSLPLDMPAKEVVEKARQAGIKLKDNYVYVVRGNAKAGKKAGAAGASRSDEAEFRRLTVQLGLGKSKELLRETEAKIADLIGSK